MKLSIRICLLVSSLLAAAPIVSHIIISNNSDSFVPISWYFLSAPLVGALLLVAHWFLAEHSIAQDEYAIVDAPLWAGLVLMLPISIFSLGWIGEYSSNELQPGEWARLLPGVVALAVVGIVHSLLASFLIIIKSGKKILAISASLAILLSSIIAIEFGLKSFLFGSQHTVSRQYEDFDEYLSEIQGNVQSLKLPHGDKNQVVGIETVSSGLMLILADGVLVVDPVVGDELWRYRFPDTVSSPFVSTSWGRDRILLESRIRENGKEDNPVSIRITLDARSGQILHKVKGEGSLYSDPPNVDFQKAIGMPPLDGEEVVPVVSQGEALRIFGASSGAFLWEFDLSEFCDPDARAGENITNDILVTDEHVFVVLNCAKKGEGQNIDSMLHAFDAYSGDLLWVDDREGMGGGVSIPSEDSLIYRYDSITGKYVILETFDGQLVSEGEWRNPGLVVDHWKEATGSGVLLREGESRVLTDLHGNPAFEIDLPGLDRGAEERVIADSRFLHMIRWNGAGVIDLTQYSWVDEESKVVADVLGRELEEGEVADLLKTPDGVVVYTSRDFHVTSAVLVG